MKDLPVISIMIPAKNEESTIGTCLESLAKTKYPKNKLDIMVIVDGSTDKTVEIASKYKPDVRVIELETQTCKAAALNKSLKFAKGDIIGIYDSDCIVEPNCISIIAKRFSNKKIDGVSGTLLSYNKESLITKALSIETTFISFVQHLIHRAGKSPMFMGKNMFIRKNILMDLGGFDEHSFSEDASLSIKMWKNHQKIAFESGAITRHEEPATFKSFISQRRRWSRGMVRATKNKLTRKEVIINFLRGTYFYVAPFGLIILVLYPIFFFFLSVYFLLPLVLLWIASISLVVYSKIFYKESLTDFVALPVWFVLSIMHIPLFINALIEEKRGTEMKWFKADRI